MDSGQDDPVAGGRCASSFRFLPHAVHFLKFIIGTMIVLIAHDADRRREQQYRTNPAASIVATRVHSGS